MTPFTGPPRGVAHMCVGKDAFPSKALADKVSARMRDRRNTNVASYRCVCCREWHIGSKPNGLRR